MPADGRWELTQRLRC